jgi:uncharacterized membrane protein
VEHSLNGERFMEIELPRDESLALAVWTRVARDAIVIALLGWAIGSRRSARRRLAIALASVAGVTVLDHFANRRVRRSSGREVRSVRRTVVVDRSPAVVYAYWRNLEQLPTFMKYLESVRDLGGRRSHWIARLPTGHVVDWDAEIVEDLPGRRLTWRSVAGADVNGRITFSPVPGGRGTEVAVEMELGTGDSVSAALAKLFAGPEVDGDLRRFKHMIEVDEATRAF